MHTAPRTLTMNIACIPKGIPQNRAGTNGEWNERWRNHTAPDEEHQTAARKQYSKSLRIHQDAGLAEAGKGARAPYHRLSVAAGDHIAKPSGIEYVNSCARRGTTLRNKTVPRVPRVANDEGHAAGSGPRAWAGLANKVQAVEQLWKSGLHGEHSVKCVKCVN